MKRKNVSALAVAGVALILLFTSCSLPTESKPRTLDRKQFPLILNPNSNSATTVPESQGKIGYICFVRQQSKNGTKTIDCVKRQLKTISPDSLFEALAAGPDDEERRVGGYSSSVPQKAELLGVAALTDSHVLGINLSDAMNNVSAPNNTIAYQQIVYTLTDPRNGLDARAVSVKISGVSTKIPTGNGPKDVAGRGDFDATVSTPQSPS